MSTFAGSWDSGFQVSLFSGGWIKVRVVKFELRPRCHVSVWVGLE